VTSCSTALVVRVQHEQEGDVAVTVMTAEKPPAAIPVFDGALHLGAASFAWVTLWVRQR